MSGKTTDQDSVEDTLKDFWATRPRRPRRGRKVAGVAAAIGERYRIDPVIARVGFAVATVFGGSGVVLYLLGWLFLPEEGDEVSPAEAMMGKGRTANSQQLTIGLCIALVVAFSWFVDNDATTYVGAAVALGLLFLLHRNRSHLGPVPTAPDPQAFGAQQFGAQAFGAQAASTQAFDPTQAQADPAGQPTTPPAWDPLGAAPFAWDLPEPGTVPPVSDPEQHQRRRQSRAGAVVLAAVVLTGGIAVAIGPDEGGWFSIRHIVGLMLGVLGLGMVLSSFRRGGRGLIGLALPLAAVGIALTVFFPQGLRADGIGEVRAKPTTLEQVQSQYRRNIGSVDVDLTALPSSGSVRTEVHADVGDVTVTVPANADVTVRCSVGAGSVSCLGADGDGVHPEQTKTDLGADGEGGLRIDLVAAVSGPGNVEVRRG